MKHYVIGLIFNNARNKVLLVRKEKPTWMKGWWNGIGGKIEHNEFPMEAMKRESREEIGTDCYHYEHRITFVCPGGTVFVFAAILSDKGPIVYTQIEIEQLEVFDVDHLPERTLDDIKWMIPICLSNIKTPLLVQQTVLVGNSGRGSK